VKNLLLAHTIFSEQHHNSVLCLQRGPQELLQYVSRLFCSQMGGAKWWWTWILGPCYSLGPPFGGYGMRLIRLWLKSPFCHSRSNVLALQDHVSICLFYAQNIPKNI